MRINYPDLLKDQAVFVLLPIILLVTALGGIGFTAYTALSGMADVHTKNRTVSQLIMKKQELEDQVRKLEAEESSPDVKKIFALEGMQFGTDASFAPLFDNMISVAKDSGVRIRAVNYNTSPEADPIFSAKIPGYNVCELDTTIVGNYSEIQTFLKTLLAEQYLVNFAQIEIVSWKRDKSVLIANFKIRFYTKTV